MTIRKILGIATMLLLTTALWAQEASKKAEAQETHGKKQTTSSKQAAKSGDIENQLIEMENKWTEAGKKGDPSLVDPILSDNFVTLNADGTYKTKKEYMAEFPKSKWEINEISHVKVHPHGNYAVVTGVWRGKGTGADGKPVDTTEHWMDTFMKMPDGSWKAISSGSTTAK